MYNLSTAASGGWTDVDYFHYTHDGPQSTVSVNKRAFVFKTNASTDRQVIWPCRGGPLLSLVTREGCFPLYYTLKGERMPAPPTFMLPAKIRPR